MNNILIWTGDFNIRDHFWDPNFPYHFQYRNILFEVANSFQLEISKPVKFHPTRYSNDPSISNSVLDLVFLWPGYPEFNSHRIYLEWRLSLDHTAITVEIPIIKEHIQTKKCPLIKCSKEKVLFINELIHSSANTNTSYLLYANNLETIVQRITYNIENLWQKYSKVFYITKRSKAWWDFNCHNDLEAYRYSQYIKDWKKFENTIKKTKHEFFDQKINEIAIKKCELWELINWIKKQKLPAIKTIQFNNQPCIKLDNLWNTLHGFFNLA